MRWGRIRLFSQARFGYCVIQRHAAVMFQRSLQALTHGLRLQQIGSFALGSNFLSKGDGHNERSGLTGFVRHNLDIGFGTLLF